MKLSVPKEAEREENIPLDTFSDEQACGDGYSCTHHRGIAVIKFS
jgi:hypothetical protein